MTSFVEDSRDRTPLGEEILTLLDDASEHQPDIFDSIIERVEEHPPREAIDAVESAIEDDRDRMDVFPLILDHLDIDRFLFEGTDAQRAFLGTVQRRVAKHHPGLRNELIPVLVDGLSDAARREQAAEGLAEISRYGVSTAQKTINELQNAPQSLFSDPDTVTAVTDVVTSIEEKFYRFQGEVELPAVARLQIGTEREAAKKELLEQADRSEKAAEEIVASADQLLGTVGGEKHSDRQSRHAAREILFELAIKYPNLVVPHTDRLVDASGLNRQTVLNAYAHILDADTDAAESLFAPIAAEATSQPEPDQRVFALADLLQGAPAEIVTAIVREIPKNSLDSPPVQDETAEKLHEDNLHLLGILCTESTAPIGQRLIAIELEEGVIRLAEDIATVVSESTTGRPFDGLSEALDRTDGLPAEIGEELAVGLCSYLQRSNASGELAATLAAPAPAIGLEVIEQVLSDQNPRDDRSDISEETFREFVKHVVEISPEVIAGRCATILEYVGDEPLDITLLDSVGEALDHAPPTVVDDEPAALELAIDFLDHEDDNVVVYACRVVAHLEPYPAPSKLRELENEASGRIEQLAAWALEYIEEANRHLETDLFDTPDSLKPAVKGLAKQGVLKYRPSNAWEDLRLGPLEADILDSVATYYNRKQSALVTHPSHDPRITLFYAIALLCEGAMEGEPPKVGIASPVYGYKDRWGTFGDIEGEYKHYGISEQEGTTIRAVTFGDLFGTAKVKDGRISRDHHGDRAGTLVLTKSVDNLSQVADELTAVVVQAVERFKIPVQELTSRINEDFGDTPVFPIYSATTKQDTGGVPDIAPPSNLEDAEIEVVSTETSLRKIGEKLSDVAAVRSVARSIGSEDDDGSIDRLHPPIRGALEAAGYTWPNAITVRAVGSESLRESVDEALDIGFDLDTCGSKILNTAFRFERLPVNASDYDAWVEEKEVVNPHSQTDTFYDQLDDIEDSTNRDHISSSTTIAVREGVRALDKVNDEVQDSNPLFERLLSRLEETVDNTDQVGIVVARQSFADILGDVLAEQLDVSNDDVVILTPEAVSSVFTLDKLFVVGPQRPAHAAVYFPSCTSQVEVLTIGTFWESYIEKHASRYRDELVEGLAVDGEVLGQLSIKTVDETSAAEEPEPRSTPTALGVPGPSEDADEPATDETEAPSAATGGGGGGAWLPDSLTEAFERAAEVESEHGSGEGSYGSRPTYEIETESGETVQLGRGEAVYRIDDHPGGGSSYTWTPPSDVGPGDEILVIDPWFFKPRRDEWLQRQYEQRFDDPEAVFRGLYDWWTAMNEILYHLDTEMGSSGSVLQSFYRAVKHEGVEKHKQTVRLWIKAIEESDAPIELATISEGTKGPSQAEDIEAIGRAFDNSKLKEDAQAIEDALDRIRRFNMIGGRQYREIIEERLEQGHPEFLEAATAYAVGEVRELDD